MLPASFLTNLKNLPRMAQLLFCACLAQRMMPNYKLFAQATGFASEDALDKYMALFWEYLGYPKARINFALQREQLDPVIPEVKNFDIYGVYPALDCCVALELLFSVVLTFDGDEAAQASQLSLSSVTNFLQMQNDFADDEAVFKEPLAVEELAFQKQCYDFALSFQRNHDYIKQVRKVARQEDVSNLGICLRDE
jgi:hypothetical protein